MGIYAVDVITNCNWCDHSGVAITEVEPHKHSLFDIGIDTLSYFADFTGTEPKLYSSRSLVTISYLPCIGLLRIGERRKQRTDCHDRYAVMLFIVDRRHYPDKRSEVFGDSLVG